MGYATWYWKGLLIGFALLFAVIVVVLWNIDCQSNEFNRYRGSLIFRDEFELQTKIWQHVTGALSGKEGFNYFIDYDTNSFVKNGNLYIRPTLKNNTFREPDDEMDLTSYGCLSEPGIRCKGREGNDVFNPLQSARIRTKKSFNFTYGTVEIRARMPLGDWIVPFIRLMPAKESKTCALELARVSGNKQLICNKKDFGNKLVRSSIVFNSALTSLKALTYEMTLEHGDFSSDFHIFGIQRTPEAIRFYVDGKHIGGVMPPAGGFSQLLQLNEKIWGYTSSMAPFDQPFYIDIGVSVGGDYFQDCEDLTEKPWATNEATPMKTFWEKIGDWYLTWFSDPSRITNALEVDYVRVYDYDPHAEGEAPLCKFM